MSQNDRAPRASRRGDTSKPVVEKATEQKNKNKRQRSLSSSEKVTITKYGNKTGKHEESKHSLERLGQKTVRRCTKSKYHSIKF
jgi:hypothetical protein